MRIYIIIFLFALGNQFGWCATFEETLEKAEKGDTQAQYLLHCFYSTGINTDRDINKAMEWLIRAAESGHRKSQYSLGLDYRSNLNGFQDNDKALKWLTKAAEQNHAGAYYSIGKMHYSGQGVEKNILKAIEFYEKAADMGDLLAQYDLGLIHFKGESNLFFPLSPNYEQAIKWWTKAGEQGRVDAQFSLGTIFRDGMGVPKNFVKSYAWFSLSSSSQYGFGKGRTELTALSRIMTAEQIAKAQEIASQIHDNIERNAKSKKDD